jgi:Fe-S cluster assembly protein SufD
MTQVAERHESFVASFEQFTRDPGFGSSELAAARQAAFARFLDRGLPSTREEEWRFTNVAPVAAFEYVRPVEAADRAAVEPFLFGGAIRHLVVLVNGRFEPALSRLDALPAGVMVQQLTEVVASGFGSIDELFPEDTPTVFCDLNAAFFNGGVCVGIAARTVVAEPIHIACIVTTGDAPVLVAPRIVVRVGEQAEASIVETHDSIGKGVALSASVVDVRLAPSAVVRHTKLQRESASVFHLAGTTVRVARAGNYDSRAITLGGRITRNDIVSTLDGEGAECTLDGLYVADGETIVDTHTTIDHAKPHCPSHEVYKGILAGKAQAVFNGKIIVRQDAQKTDAKQTNKALLLSGDARINTKPQLEIFADDVKCTHGAAIGQLDEDAMFYLRARGIAAVDARNLLIHAFAGEVVDGISVPAVREEAMHALERKLSLAEVTPEAGW